MTKAALSDGSGIGLSLMAVRDDCVAVYKDCEERTMERMASGVSCEGGSDGVGA